MREQLMLKATAISLAVIIAVVTIDWAIMNGYRNYLALPLIGLWLFTAVGLIRHIKNTR